MGEHLVRLALVLALIALNAVFAGSELALVSLRDAQLRRLARSSRGGRVLARLAGDPNRYLATIQIGITLAGFLASAVAAVSLAEPLRRPLGFLGSAAEPVAVVTVTTLLTFITLVLGELAPKRIAMQRAERWALLIARPLNWLATLTRPAVWLLSRATDLVVRMAGADPQASREAVSTEELREMVVARSDVSAQQREILSGAFEIADRTLREVLVPRRAIVALPADLPAPDGLRRLAQAGRSRAPVTGPAGLDEIRGAVHLRDLVDVGRRTVGERARPVLFLPETLRVAEAMRQMRARHAQLALVVNEWGATDGMVTMADLLEEVVGELYDETDRDVQAVTREEDGALLVPGGFPLHDLDNLDVRIDLPRTSDYTTVAGMVIAQLGRLPSTPGDRVCLPGLTVEVVEVTGHTIGAVRLRRNDCEDHQSVDRSGGRPQ